MIPEFDLESGGAAVVWCLVINPGAKSPFGLLARTDLVH
jgi:hypothetical protein